VGAVDAVRYERPGIRKGRGIGLTPKQPRWVRGDDLDADEILCSAGGGVKDEKAAVGQRAAPEA
jgi:hypothetical protein